MGHLNRQAGVSIGAPARVNSIAQKRHTRQIGRWFVRVLLALCFLAGFYFSVLPSGRATTRSLLILPGLLSASQINWQAPVAEPIAHTQLTIPSTVGTVYLDVYAPIDSVPPVPGTREAVLVVPGVGDERKEPQLINFSETLARAGVVVMDMVTPTLMSYRLDASDKEAVVQAFYKLQNWPGVGANRVGMVGFSAGGSLLCLAAADARLQSQVKFVTFFGGYYNATTLLQTIGRRALTVNDQTQPWHPVDVPLQVLSNTIAPFLSTSEGQLIINAFASGGSGKLTSAQLAQLSPGGAAAYHLLEGDQPDQVEANLAALSPAVKGLLTSLSPSSVLDQLHAPIYLLHDRNDQYVPYSESHEFADALAKIHHPYDFVELGVFQHVEVRADQGWLQLLGDGKNMLRLIGEIVAFGS